MNTLKYNSEVTGLVMSVGLGTSPDSPVWCFVDDKGLFHDTESYKKDTPFNGTNKFQQISFMSTIPSNAIKVPQKLTASIGGDNLVLSLTTVNANNAYIGYYTTSFSSMYPSNGDTMTLTTNISDPTVDTLRVSHVNFTLNQYDFPSDVTCNYNQPGSYHTTGSTFIS